MLAGTHTTTGNVKTKQGMTNCLNSFFLAVLRIWPEKWRVGSNPDGCSRIEPPHFPPWRKNLRWRIQATIHLCVEWIVASGIVMCRNFPTHNPKSFVLEGQQYKTWNLKGLNPLSLWKPVSFLPEPFLSLVRMQGVVPSRSGIFFFVTSVFKSNRL